MINLLPFGRCRVLLVGGSESCEVQEALAKLQAEGVVDTVQWWR